METLKGTIFSNDIDTYKYALKSIPQNEEATKVSYASNDTVSHAKALFEELLDRATETVRIKSSMFCKEFYKDKELLDKFKDVAEKKEVKVKILVANIENEINDQELMEEYNRIKNVEVKKTDKPFSYNDFMIVDQHSFRYELENFNEEACEGDNVKDIKSIALFNADKDKSHMKRIELLTNSFETVFSKDL